MRERRRSAASVPWTVRTIGAPLRQPPGRRAPTSGRGRDRRRRRSLLAAPRGGGRARDRRARAIPRGRPERGLHGAPVGQRLAPRADAYRTRRTGTPSSSSSPPLPSSLGATTRTSTPRRTSAAGERWRGTRPETSPATAGIVVGQEDHPHAQSRTSSLSSRASARAISRVSSCMPGDHLADEAEAEERRCR